MRKYQNKDGKVAIMKNFGSHVICEVGSTMRWCSDFADAVAWLTKAFGCGWCRVR